MLLGDLFKVRFLQSKTDYNLCLEKANTLTDIIGKRCVAIEIVVVRVEASYLLMLDSRQRRGLRRFVQHLCCYALRRTGMRKIRSFISVATSTE